MTRSRIRHMRIALVHDDLVQWGGAERVFLEISNIFPEAPIYTSVFDQSNSILVEKFSGKEIKTSFLQKVPFWRDLYKALLPFYPLAFEQFDFTEFDLVISHGTRFAKAVITKPGTLHINYCHTPPRFLWGFSGEKVFPILNPYFSFLRKCDLVFAKRVDYFWAGSKNAHDRIKKVYGEDCEVLYPFVDLERFKDLDSFDGDYYLVIARLNSYKRVDLAVKACQDMGRKLKVVGDGMEMGKLETKRQRDKENEIEFLGSMSEEAVLSLLAGCRGLIVTAEEDFGLTSLEAQACGKGVIAFGKGGSLETVIDGETGVFFEEQSVDSLKKGLEKFEKLKIDPDECKETAAKFSKEKFKKRLLNLIDGVKIGN